MEGCSVALLPSDPVDSVVQADEQAGRFWKMYDCSLGATVLDVSNI